MKNFPLRFPPRRILALVDVSAPSLCALEGAKTLARACGSALDVVYVQDAGFGMPALYQEGIVAAMPDLEQIKDECARKCLARLKEASKGFPASRLRVRAARGFLPEKLVELASGKGADLVVMGTHGYRGMNRALLGSMAETVVRRATAPVLAMHGRRLPWRVSRVLVPCNLTPYADKTLAYALELARGLGASAEALYVASTGESRPRLLEELRRHVSAAATAGASRRVSLRVAHGDPREAIVEHAKRGKFDLVVLSAHRRPFSSDFVIGSTVERVLRHCPVPVLSVPSLGSERWKEVRSSAGGMLTEKVNVLF